MAAIERRPIPPWPRQHRHGLPQTGGTEQRNQPTLLIAAAMAQHDQRNATNPQKIQTSPARCNDEPHTLPASHVPGVQQYQVFSSSLHLSISTHENTGSTLRSTCNMLKNVLHRKDSISFCITRGGGSQKVIRNSTQQQRNSSSTMYQASASKPRGRALRY